MFVLKLLLNLVIFSVPAAAAAFTMMKFAKTSRDEWKILVFLPVLPLAIWGVFIAWGVTRDRTSHNLWPFELVIWGSISLLLMGIVLLARRFLSPR